jgi:hypothetical protein
MELDKSQRDKVTDWLKQGLKLSDIQNRIAAELGLRLTYMEVRLLVDDLKLSPKDVEPPQPAASPLAAPGRTNGSPKPAPPASALPAAREATGESGGVSVTVDQLARPGALVSGKVTFSDGVRAEWYLDQTGQVGLVAPKPGYRPPPEDVREFQAALDQELTRAGF